MTPTSLTLREAIAGVSHALARLAETLTKGDAAQVLDVEAALARALDSLRLSIRAGHRDVSAAALTEVRERLAQCRRLGGTVPALLSVMFPGQLTYGPALARTGTRLPGASSLTRVI